MDILSLLDRSEWSGYNGGGTVCPECDFDADVFINGRIYKGDHRTDCELKAAIDALRSGQLQVVDIDAPNPDSLTMEQMLKKIIGLKKEQR